MCLATGLDRMRSDARTASAYTEDNFSTNGSNAFSASAAYMAIFLTRIANARSSSSHNHVQLRMHLDADGNDACRDFRQLRVWQPL